MHRAVHKNVCGHDKHSCSFSSACVSIKGKKQLQLSHSNDYQTPSDVAYENDQAKAIILPSQVCSDATHNAILALTITAKFHEELNDRLISS